MANLNKEVYVDFTREPLPLMNTLAAMGVPVDTDTVTNRFYIGEKYFEVNNIGTNTDIVFSKAVTAPLGWVVPNDAADNDGIEITQGVAAADAQSFYTIGTSPAFFLEVGLTIPVVADYDVAFIGFRKVEAYSSSTTAITTAALLLSTYDDVAGLNVDNEAIKTITREGTATGAATDTTDVATLNVGIKLRVNISAAGVVTFQRSLTADGDLAAPTVTLAATLTTGSVVVPTFICVKDANGTDTPPVLQYWKCGYQ